MAFIVPSGSLVSCVNGKVGDVVFYRGRWGQVARKWVYPTNTITARRTNVRSNFASLISLYNSLTQEMQNEWNVFASTLVKLNRVAYAYVPTGLQIFMERNINLSMIAQGPLLVPPVDASLPAYVQFNNPVMDIANVWIHLVNSINDIILPADIYAIIYATNNVAAHVRNKKNRYRIITTYPPGGTTNGNLINEWDSAWAPAEPIPGMRIFTKAVFINGVTGQASPPIYCSKLVS